MDVGMLWFDNDTHTDLFKKIEIVNLDKWVANFLKSHNYPHNVVYSSKTQTHWETALTYAPAELGLKRSFYREEWERIIQPQEIETVDAYMRAPRLGCSRGVRACRAYPWTPSWSRSWSTRHYTRHHGETRICA